MKHPQPQIRAEDDGLLYLKVPAIEALDKKSMTIYANQLNKPLTKKYKGIIVDLRGNTGGNMAPMLIGLSGLLPDGDLFRFEDRYHNQQVIQLNGHELSHQENLQLEQSVIKQKVPVAVLIDRYTASSGEMTAFAFQGLEHTLFFEKQQLATPLETMLSLYMMVPCWSLLAVVSLTVKDKPTKTIQSSLIEKAKTHSLKPKYGYQTLQNKI